MNILILSPYLPAIDTTACAREIYERVSLLRQKGCSVYLLSFCAKEDRERINAIRPHCAGFCLEYISDYSRYPAKAGLFKGKINSLCKKGNIDILQCEKAYMSRYIPRDNKVVSILIEHEILSISFLERAKLETNLINKLILFVRTIKKRFEEKKWYRRFNKIIVFSENDKDVIRGLYNLKNIEVIPLGINLRNYPPRQSEEKHYDIIFVGNFSHFPNVDAVSYFHNSILPLLKKRLPNITVVLAGSNPPGWIRELAKSDRNILVTGYVKDILEIYSKSKVFIAPIRCGGGMSFKILEALALSMPVVATSVGARGIAAGNIVKIADTKEEFADTVIDLLNHPSKHEELSENGRRTVEKYYSWDRILPRYENIYSNESDIHNFSYL